MKQGIFLRAMSEDGAAAHIDVVGVIGWEVWYSTMRDMLRAIPESVKQVVFDIYSPGGDVWEGNGIVQEIGLLSKRCETVARVQIAASMATLIAVACDKRTIARNGRFLIHNAWSEIAGNAADLEKMAKSLRDCEAEAARFYAERTGQSEDAVRVLMNDERWLLPEEAVSLGFVSEIVDPFKEDEFVEVKQEIVQAGKWPKALADMQKDEDVKKPAEEPDATETEPGTGDASQPGEGDAATAADDDAGKDGAGEAGAEQPAEATQEPVAAPEEERIAVIVADRTCKLSDDVAALRKKADEIEHARRETQSKHDRLQAAYDKTVADHAATIKALETAKAEEIAAITNDFVARMEIVKTQLEQATSRLAKFTRGSLEFTPEVNTWEQALAACGGGEKGLIEARKKHPDLYKAYMAPRLKGT